MGLAVRGSIPQYDDLLPMAKPMVRLLGLYRETLQPEKKGGRFFEASAACR